MFFIFGLCLEPKKKKEKKRFERKKRLPRPSPKKRKDEEISIQNKKLAPENEEYLEQRDI